MINQQTTKEKSKIKQKKQNIDKNEMQKMRGKHKQSQSTKKTDKQQHKSRKQKTNE